MTALLEIVPEIKKDLSSYTTKQLRDALATGLRLTATSLTQLAAIWHELEQRGEDLRDLRVGLSRMLPLIAAKRLAAEAVVAFAGRPALLRAMDGLPLDQQRELAQGKIIDIVVPAEPSKVEKLPLADIPTQLASLVLHEGRIRTPQEQRVAIRKSRQRPTKPVEKILIPYYNKSDATIKVGHNSVKLDQLLDAIAGPDTSPMDVPSEWGKVFVKLTKKELSSLNNKADKLDLPAYELIRKAMRAFGLI